ncbi:general substrate transporter [Xylogone sp. PMI_703]|nr:general substrate transporter [Xylogone sp. PMI_703]
MCIIMDGYDQALMGSFFGYPAFQKRYGYEVGDTGKYQLPARWQSALGFASSLGNIVGIFINSITTERFGHKKSLLVTLVILIGLIFIPFFAPSIEVLFVGQLLCGIAWGVFTTLAPAYASEVCPVVLRASLETFVVLCWGIGQFVAWGVLVGLNQKAGQWAYRIPFAVQWVWPAIILPIAIFAPESPWWLVRKGRLEEAERSVIRLSSTAEKENAKKAVALMIETNSLEMELTKGARFIDCFRGSNLWRTEISCFAWASQVWGGFVIQAYSTYFFEQAGLPAASAYKMNVGVGGLHFVCTLCSVFVTNRFGRRTLFLCGLVGMSTTLFIIGFMALGKQSTAMGYAQSVMYLIWYAIYEFSVGPLAYIVVAESSSTRLRSKTIGLARNLYNVSNIIGSVVTPYILNTDKAIGKAKSASCLVAWQHSVWSGLISGSRRPKEGLIRNWTFSLPTTFPQDNSRTRSSSFILTL